MASTRSSSLGNMGQSSPPSGRASISKGPFSSAYSFASSSLASLYHTAILLHRRRGIGAAEKGFQSTYINSTPLYTVESTLPWKKKAGDASLALLATFQLFARCFPDDSPPSFDASCSRPSSAPLAENPLLMRARRHEDEGSLLMTCGTCVAIYARKPIRLCLQCWYRACAYSTIGSACRLSPSLVKVQTVAVPPASARL